MALPFCNRQRVGYSEINGDDAKKFNSNRSFRVLAIFAAVLVLAASLVATLLPPSTPPGALSPEKQHQHEILKESLKKQKAKQKAAATATKKMLNDAMDRNEKCFGIDWQQACESITGAGARRQRRRRLTEEETTEFTELEEYLLSSDDPGVIYDENCLRVYRLDLFGKTTFPYHASHLLRAGGNETMALFIQHGAVRNADSYFCSFRSLMLEQSYRPFQDIMIIAADFNYRNDPGVLPTDAFWNATKPWGDWRAGAESDPECCGNGLGTHGGRTISSFAILDQMLEILTDKKLYPRMDKISYVGHSAGGQMVQRYAIMSELAAKWDVEGSRVDLEFVIANPSSYSYLDGRRFSYSCGDCECNEMNCTCSADCSDPAEGEFGLPDKKGEWPCHEPQYNRWPYGLSGFTDLKHRFPYPLRSGPKRAAKAYRKRDVVYMVGQNDTCNDGLPTCNPDCWKREDYLPEEWPCFRNHMDTRCPAMMEGPFRRARGLQYMKYLEEYYGEKTHRLIEVPGVGHNATGMFGSKQGLKELFD